MKPPSEYIFRNIFVIRNHTLKEAYFGTTPGPIRKILSKLRHRRIKTIRHWDWETHDIRCRVLARRLLAPVALYRLWQYKKETRKGWRNL